MEAVEMVPGEAEEPAASPAPNVPEPEDEIATLLERAAHYRRSLLREEIDPRWAAETETFIRNSIADALPGAVIDTIRCHSTLCEVELSSDVPFAHARRAVVHAVGSRLPAAFGTVPSSDRLDTTTFFFARRGHELPRAEGSPAI